MLTKAFFFGTISLKKPKTARKDLDLAMKKSIICLLLALCLCLCMVFVACDDQTDGEDEGVTPAPGEVEVGKKGEVEIVKNTDGKVNATDINETTNGTVPRY